MDLLKEEATFHLKLSKLTSLVPLNACGIETNICGTEILIPNKAFG